VIIRVASGGGEAGHPRSDPGPEAALKLPGGHPKHEVACRAVVKGEMATAAHSTVISGGDDDALASIAAKNRN
jgi:hypothetical protein